MEYFTEASLSDSHMFQQLNKSSSVTANIAKALKNGTVIDQSYFEQQYLMMTKTRVSPISETVIKAFDAGKIKLIYNKNDHVTVAIPFTIVNLKGEMTACIFINEFSGITKTGEPQLTIDMKKLYTLMEAAYIGLLYFTKPTEFIRNATFVRTLANIYAQMILRIYNREYALSLNKDAFDTVNYYAARFFLERVLGVNNTALSSAYAKATCNKPAQTVIDVAETGYETENPQNIEEFVLFAAKADQKMADLKYRYFFQRWVTSYGTGASLAIDSFPYFFYCFSNVMCGGFLVNTTSLSELVKNTPGILNIYPEIARIANTI